MKNFSRDEWWITLKLVYWKVQQKECRFFGINAGWFDEQHLLGNNIIVEYFYNQLCLFVFNIPWLLNTHAISISFSPSYLTT